MYIIGYVEGTDSERCISSRRAQFSLRGQDVVERRP
jgi:hypothetical protein